MTNTPDADPGLPPSLRFLKGLVTVLMVTMIVGVITVVWLLVTRMPDATSLPPLPEQITLPDGAKAQGITVGQGWFGVVTMDQQLLLFTTDGQLRQKIDITGLISPTE